MGSAAPAPALRFSLIGFPVRIDASFPVLLGLLGFGFPIRRLGLWVLVATVSVLAHEMGHALACRAVGASASISLEGLGGLTRPHRAEPFSRREDAVVSAAGPAVGLLLGVITIAVWAQLHWPYATTGGFILGLFVFTTAGWSVLNLLPILPLDGGHLLVAALRGPPARRQILAARISIGVAALGGLLAFRSGMSFTALFAAMLAGQNLTTIRRLEQQTRLGGLAALYENRQFDEVVAQGRVVAGNVGLPAGDRATGQQYVVLGLLMTGRDAEARAEAGGGGPEGVEIGAAFRGFVMTATGDVENGLALARRAAEEQGDDASIHWYQQALQRSGTPQGD